MKKIRILSITFDTEIEAFEIPAFRGAIASKVDPDSVLYHNHVNKGYRYSYPLIQYKRSHKKPLLICVEEGVDEIHKYFENKCWDIEISGRWVQMKIASLNMNQFTMQVWDKMFDYRIGNWIALNQENYALYMAMKDESEKTAFLKSTLTANILSFAKGIDWHIEKPVEVIIKEVKAIRPVRLKGQKVLGFDIEFSSNVFLPNNVGLGKSVSIGFGQVYSIRKNSINEQ